MIPSAFDQGGVMTVTLVSDTLLERAEAIRARLWVAKPHLVEVNEIHDRHSLEERLTCAVAQRAVRCRREAILGPLVWAVRI